MTVLQEQYEDSLRDNARLHKALMWMRDRDDRNGSLPDAYRLVLDNVLVGKPIPQSLERAAMTKPIFEQRFDVPVKLLMTRLTMAVNNDVTCIFVTVHGLDDDVLFTVSVPMPQKPLNR